MGKRPQRHSWPEAKKLCRLNQHDIAMAKALGFHPEALVRASPDPKQKWKLPVKYWIRELHFKRIGKVLGEEPPPVASPEATEPVDIETLAEDFWEQQFWEDYRARNSGEAPKKGKGFQPTQPTTANAPVTDLDVPF